MMRWITLVVLLLVSVGCSHSVNDIVRDPSLILRDPHYREFKQEVDSWERRYLRGEITYREYINKKEELEQKYDKEVRERTEIIQRLD